MLTCESEITMTPAQIESRLNRKADWHLQATVRYAADGEECSDFGTVEYCLDRDNQPAYRLSTARRDTFTVADVLSVENRQIILK